MASESKVVLSVRLSREDVEKIDAFIAYQEWFDKNMIAPFGVSKHRYTRSDAIRIMIQSEYYQLKESDDFADQARELGLADD